VVDPGVVLPPPEHRDLGEGWRRSSLARLGPAFLVRSSAPELGEYLYFSLLSQFTSCGGDLGSSRLDNVVR
jgi:hypothetical protein